MTGSLRSGQGGRASRSVVDREVAEGPEAAQAGPSSVRITARGAAQGSWPPEKPGPFPSCRPRRARARFLGAVDVQGLGGSEESGRARLGRREPHQLSLAIYGAPLLWEGVAAPRAVPRGGLYS